MNKFHRKVVGVLMMFGIAFLVASTDQAFQQNRIIEKLKKIENSLDWKSSDPDLEKEGSVGRFMHSILRYVDFEDQCNHTGLNLSEEDRELVLDQFEEQWNEHIGSMGSIKLTRNWKDVKLHRKNPWIQLEYYMTVTDPEKRTELEYTVPITLKTAENDAGFDVKIGKVVMSGSKLDIVQEIFYKNIDGKRVTICDVLSECVDQNNCSTHPFFADDKKASSEEAIN